PELAGDIERDAGRRGAGRKVHKPRDAACCGDANYARLRAGIEREHVVFTERAVCSRQPTCRSQRDVGLPRGARVTARTSGKRLWGASGPKKKKPAVGCKHEPPVSARPDDVDYPRRLDKRSPRGRGGGRGAGGGGDRTADRQHESPSDQSPEHRVRLLRDEWTSGGAARQPPHRVTVSSQA